MRSPILSQGTGTRESIWCMAVALALIAYLMGYLQARGQTSPDNITIGSVKLTLGMSKDIVLTTLNKSYDTKSMGEGLVSPWLVTQKNEPSKTVGSVVFKDGKLSTIMKYWTPEDQQKGYELAKHLYGLIESFNSEGKRLCSIETATKHDPGWEAKTIFITCGAKYARIDLSDSEQYGKSTDMSEVLERK